MLPKQSNNCRKVLTTILLHDKSFFPLYLNTTDVELILSRMEYALNSAIFDTVSPTDSVLSVKVRDTDEIEISKMIRSL